MSNPTRAQQRKHASGLKKKLKAMFNEYIKEAEHGDGPAFWENFKTMEEIFQDMALYARDAKKPVAES